MSDLPAGFILDAPTPAAPDSSLPPGFVLDAQPSGIMTKLGKLWDNPPPGGIVSAVKPIVQGIGTMMQAGHGDIPMVGPDGHTNPAVIDASFEAAKGLSPATAAPFGMRNMAAMSSIFPGRSVEPPPMPPALQSNISAQNIGVDLPRAIATDSPFIKFMGQVSNKMPGGGPMQTGVGNALTQTGDAVANAATMAGGATDAMAAGQGFKSAVQDSFKPAIKARVSDAYDQVDKFVDPAFTRSLDATQGTIADIMARRVASGEGDPGKAVNTVLGGVVRPGGLTYQGVKDLRTRVGEMIDTGVFPEGMSQAELRRIYGSLSDDLQATVQGAGGQEAVNAFNKANATAKFVADWKDNLGKIIGTDRSGEGITSAILRMASDAPTADLKALTMARAAVPKTAWQDIASTTISSLGKDRKGEFSPALFLNDFTKLSDGGKRLLFGSAGSGDVLPYLNDIATVSKKFIEAGKLANTSGTAGHNAAYTMMGGAAAGALHGSLIEPISAVTTVIGNNLLARALSAPASAASVARWTRAYQALAQNPVPASIGTFNMASRNLATTINGQFGVSVKGADFMRAIQGPAKSPAGQDQPQ